MYTKIIGFSFLSRRPELNVIYDYDTWSRDKYPDIGFRVFKLTKL